MRQHPWHVVSGQTHQLLYSISNDRGFFIDIGLGATADLDGVGEHAAARSGYDEPLGAGIVRAFSGQSGNILYTIGGGPADKNLGHRLASIPDVNGDGRRDLAVTAANHLFAPAELHEVRILSGRTGAHLFSRFHLGAGDRFGDALGGADIDLDGIGDVIIGAPGIDRVDIVSGTCEGVTPVGSSTAGSGGIAPSLSADGCAWQGRTDFALDIAGAVGGSSAFLLIGVQSASIPVASGTLHVDVSAPFVLTPALPLAGPAGVPGAGNVAVPFAIPLTPALAGATFYAQALVPDAGALAGLAHTNGAKIVVAP